MDSSKFPVREQGPETGLVHLHKYYSKTQIDKNPGRAPSEVGEIREQKRRPIRSALKNGGPADFDGVVPLKPVR